MGTFEHTPLTENYSGFQLFHSYWEHIDMEKKERYFFEVLSIAKDGIFIPRNANSLGISQGYDEFAEFYKKSGPSATAPSDEDLHKLYQIIETKNKIIAEYKKRYSDEKIFEEKTANAQASREKDVRNLLIGVAIKEHACAEKLAEIQPYSIKNIIASASNEIPKLMKENLEDIESNKLFNKMKRFFGFDLQR